MKLVSISVDLDEVECYHSIHGLKQQPDEAVSAAVHLKALPRFLSLFDKKGIKATMFVIGREIGQNSGVDEILRQMHQDGHELANHTLNHRYNLVQLEEDVIRKEVLSGASRIEALCGERPVGFRAPGYTVSDALLRILEDQRYLYDSSVFPCPAYYSAKTVIMAGYQVVGRTSRSILGTPGVMRAPSVPYRAGTPFYTRGNGIREIPIGVAGPARIPFFGTSILLAGQWLYRYMTASMMSREFINVELHGMDLGDAVGDGLEYLAKHQPDLRLSLDYRIQRYEHMIDMFRENGYEFVTLKEAVSRIQF